MPTTIKLKNSVTTTAAPTTLVQGEVAANVTDKKLWIGNAASSPVQILGAGATVSGTDATFTGVTTVQAGTVSAPAITTTGDTNTGIFFPAADTIAFTEGGVESMRIDSSGNVGIGVTPSNAFATVKSIEYIGGAISGLTTETNFSLNSHLNSSGNWVYKTTAAASLYQIKPASFVWNYAASGTAGSAVSFTEAMRIDASGNLGIGTSSPITPLDVKANSFAQGLNIKGRTSDNFGLVTFSTTGGTINSYMGSPDSIALTFYTNGFNERMRIDSSGNVGIGTSSPASYGKLAIAGNTTVIGGAGFYLQNTNNSAFSHIKNSGGAAVAQLEFYTDDAERMRIDSSGNVGIGISSPAYKLHVNKGSAGIIANFTDGVAQTLLVQTDASGVTLSNDNSGYIAFANTAERMRIDSSGRVLIGTTSASAGVALKVAGGIIGAIDVYNNTTASAANMFIDSSGFFARSTSSLKYKTDIQDATHGLAEVLKLRSVTYKGKTDGETVLGGLIAEEVDAAGLTEFVQYAEDGSPDALAYGQMVSLAFKAIQEQQALIENLTTRLNALEAK